MESARLGLPGERENIVKLNADHGGVCRFGDSQTDQDNFKLVRRNLSDLYENALKNSELRTTLTAVGKEEAGTGVDELQQRFAKLGRRG